MKVEPLSTYAAPAYPTRERFNTRPELLFTCVPRGWKRGLVASALLAFVAGGCTGQKPKKTTVNDSCPKKPPLVAPIFKHGEGEGSIGGIVNFGSFISENDAHRIINDELKKYGIELNDKYTLPSGFFNVDTGETFYGKAFRSEVPLDGYSSKRNLGYEFVSTEDYFIHGGERSDMTVQPFQIKEIAESLQKRLKNYGKINAVVFYDPVVSLDENDYKVIEKLAEDKRYKMEKDLEKNMSEKMIRMQARDFIKWAKKNGVLKACDDNK